MYIYVLDINGKPLMPTQRAGKARRMLRDGLASIVSHTPFTIRLTYETTAFTQPVSLGIVQDTRTDKTQQHIYVQHLKKEPSDSSHG